MKKLGRLLSASHGLSQTVTGHCIRLSYGGGAGTERGMDEGEGSPLYDHHIPTSVIQKIILAGGSAVTALADPWRADMVAVNGEVTGIPALRSMHARMQQSCEGRSILSAQPRITSSILPSLSLLHPSTIGYQYQAFLVKYNISPDSRAAVTFVDSPELAYVMTRYRETHDLTHCVLALPTTMVGEVAVKWVEALQLGLPMCVAGAIFGPLRFGPKQRKQYRAVLPWAVHTGKTASFLLNVHYENRWSQDMDDFRREFNITQPPRWQ